MHHYRRGVWPAFHLGREHGQFWLGCCWALMLVAFAAGVADLVWMAALATLLAYEKIGRRGVVVGRVAGAVLVGWGWWSSSIPAGCRAPGGTELTGIAQARGGNNTASWREWGEEAVE
jgi:predicted metal-binding membrane protein